MQVEPCPDQNLCDRHSVTAAEVKHHPALG